MSEKPSSLPVRERNGQWEILIIGKDQWFPCESKDDAVTLASGPVLERDALAEVRADEEFAEQLEKAAQVFEKYRMGFGSRFLRRRADEIRGRVQL